MPAEQHGQSVTVRTRSSFVRQGEEAGDPSLNPLFINNVEISLVGTDVFLDLGVIQPADVMALKAQSGDEVQELTFHVTERVVMSVNTFARPAVPSSLPTSSSGARNVRFANTWARTRCRGPAT